MVTEEKDLDQLGLIIIDAYFEAREPMLKGYSGDEEWYRVNQIEENPNEFIVKADMYLMANPFSNYWGTGQSAGGYVKKYFEWHVKKISEDKYEVYCMNKVY